MFDRFTDRARKIMAYSRQEAQRFNHEYIGTEHILLAFLRENGLGMMAIEHFGVNPARVVLEVEKIIQSGPSMVTVGQLPFTPRAKKVLELSVEEASNLNHNYIGDEHLLLGLIRENEGVAAQVLMYLGMTTEDVRSFIRNSLGEPPRFFVFANGGLTAFHHEGEVLAYVVSLERMTPGTKVQVIEGRRRNLKSVNITTEFELE